MDESQTPTPQKSSMGMYLGIGVVLLLAVAGYMLLSNQSNQPAQTTNQTTNQTQTTQATPTTEPTTTEATDSAQSGNVKTFTVSGRNFAFDVKEMRVKKGDRVKVVFTSSSGIHDWALDEFSVKTKQLQSGQTDEVEFVASKAGTFEYYCSVGQHRQMGMVGKLIVE